MSKNVNYGCTNAPTLETINTIERAKKQIADYTALAKIGIAEELAPVADALELEADALTEKDLHTYTLIKLDAKTSALVNGAIAAIDKIKSQLKKDTAPHKTALNDGIKSYTPDYLYRAYVKSVSFSSSRLSMDLMNGALIRWFMSMGYKFPEVMTEYAVQKNLDVISRRISGYGHGKPLTFAQFSKKVYDVMFDYLINVKGVLTLENGVVTNTYDTTNAENVA